MKFHQFTAGEIAHVLENYNKKPFTVIAKEAGITELQVNYVLNKARQFYEIPKKTKLAYFGELVKQAVETNGLDFKAKKQ